MTLVWDGSRQNTLYFVSLFDPEMPLPKEDKEPLDFPFDMDKLFSFQFDQLKKAIEYLARNQGDQ